MNKNDIPEIQFKKKSRNSIDFEILPLSTIYKRHNEGKIDFNIHAFHRPQFNMILFIEEGTGMHFIDFQTCHYESGDMIFVAANQVHAFDIDRKTKALMILFTTEFLMNGLIHREVRSTNNLIRNTIKNPILRNYTKTNTIKQLFHMIEEEYNDKNEQNKNEIIRHLFSALCIKLNSLNDNNLGENANTEWQRVMNSLDKAIEDGLFKCRDAGKYANKIRCSYKHLNTICKSMTGQTAKQYIDFFVTLEIKRFLATTGMNVRELCEVFDFDEETNFVKYFKKHTGISPKKFRDQFIQR